MTDAPSSTTPSASSVPPARRVGLWTALPLAVFAGLAGLLALGLDGRDPSRLPSALIGRPAPPLSLPPLEGVRAGDAAVPGFDPATLQGRTTLLNFFASWCPPCRDEHPLLVDLARRGHRVVGVNHKDTGENARRFLASLGNPYAAIGADPSGRAAIEWGVYGMPESFVIGPDGRVLAKHVGPLTPEVLAGPFGRALGAPPAS